MIQQIDGELYPESEFPKSGKRFRGFDWRGEERPMSVDDLFKDDPPLVLPIIKGLDDYVPSEEFIDDSVNKRIKEAGRATPNQPKLKALIYMTIKVKLISILLQEFLHVA